MTKLPLSRRAQVQGAFLYRNMFHGNAVPFLRLKSGVHAMFKRLRKEGVLDLASYIDVDPGFVRRAMEASVIVEANKTAVQLYGAQNEEELRGPMTRLWEPEQDLVFRRSIEAAFRGEAGYQGEARLTGLDGRKIDVIIFTIGAPAMRERGIVLVGHIDIASQVSLRQELDRIRADLVHSSRMTLLGELVASVAHEVNQPLSAIVTNGEAALRWMNRIEPDISEARAAMQRLLADARRAADVVQRVRNLASPWPVEPVPSDVNALIEEIALLLRGEMEAHHVKCNLHLESNPRPVVVDRVQIQQVLMNLAINAIQAMSAREESKRLLRIRAELVSPDDVRVTIEDSGSGIEEHEMARLFERFYSTKPGGMGMGLPISQSIVEAHGSRILVSSTIGVGSRFWFDLPTVATMS